VHPPQRAYRTQLVGKKLNLFYFSAVQHAAFVQTLLSIFGKDKLIGQGRNGYFAKQILLRPVDTLFVVGQVVPVAIVYLNGFQ
jgi:hypothetical protein